MTNTLHDICFNTIGPVLFDYVCWILCEAQKKGIKTIYFLARDGYLLLQIAERICADQNIPIRCKYLYCSRNALRLPTYHIIGEEAYDLLLLGSYRTSRYSILDRISLSDEQRKKIYHELGFDFNDEKKILTQEEFKLFTDLLRQNDTFRKLVFEKSKEVYPATIGYLRQEGLLEEEKVAIADSGWSGTMQRSLRQLLEHTGYKGEIIGFYFGMYHFFKKEPCDGEFNCWYFFPNSSPINKVLFCNNLFECFLSAPHGMTISYELRENRYQPILGAEPPATMKKIVDDQIKFCLQYTESKLDSFLIGCFNEKKAKKESQILLRRFMAKPQKEEVRIYSQFLFCDDISDNNLTPLVAQEQYSLLKDNYLIVRRLWRKLCGTSKRYVNKELFWPYGTARLAKNPMMAYWYWLNIFLWEFMRFYFHKR